MSKLLLLVEIVRSDILICAAGTELRCSTNTNGCISIELTTIYMISLSWRYYIYISKRYFGIFNASSSSNTLTNVSPLVSYDLENSETPGLSNTKVTTHRDPVTGFQFSLYWSRLQNEFNASI